MQLPKLRLEIKKLKQKIEQEDLQIDLEKVTMNILIYLIKLGIDFVNVSLKYFVFAGFCQHCSSWETKSESGSISVCVFFSMPVLDLFVSILFLDFFIDVVKVCND